MNRQDRQSGEEEIREVRAINEIAVTDIKVAEMTTKFSGVILRKAELENNFEKVYSRVFEKMIEFEFFGGGENVLEIFGESGG